MSNQERVEKMGDEIKRRNRDRFLYSPPGWVMMVDEMVVDEMVVDG